MYFLYQIIKLFALTFSHTVSSCKLTSSLIQPKFFIDLLTIDSFTLTWQKSVFITKNVHKCKKLGMKIDFLEKNDIIILLKKYTNVKN